jgi:hypothetical protein
MVGMQPSEALGVAAQVAVTLAGFAGIVVVFRPESVHQWSALDRFRLRLLLANSALPLGYSLFGMFLLTIDPPLINIWRWCSGFAFLTQLGFLVAARSPRRIIPPAEFQAVSKIMYYSVSALASIALVLQVINVAVWNRFWPFFGAIFVQLIAAIAQFVRMILLPHKPSSG